MKHIKVICGECEHVNKIPLQKIYDGFDGVFICSKCNTVLDNIHGALDEGED